MQPPLSIQDVFSLLSMARRPHYYLSLNRIARADLQWWACFLQSWNGISFLSLGEPHIHIYSDTSGSFGCSAFDLSRSLFQLPWPTQTTRLPPRNCCQWWWRRLYWGVIGQDVSSHSMSITWLWSLYFRSGQPTTHTCCAACVFMRRTSNSHSQLLISRAGKTWQQTTYHGITFLYSFLCFHWFNSHRSRVPFRTCSFINNWTGALQIG